MKKAELASTIIGKLLNIGGMLNRRGNQVLLPYDMNMEQFSIFFEIANVRKVRQKDVVNRLLLNKSHISKAVCKLNKMRLINVVQSNSDGRSSWLSLTKKGENMLSEIRGIFNKWNLGWIEKLNGPERHALLDSLDKMQKILKAGGKE